MSGMSKTMNRSDSFVEFRRFKEEFMSAHILNFMKAAALVCIILAIIGHLLFSFEFLHHGITFEPRNKTDLHERNSTPVGPDGAMSRVLLIGWGVFDAIGSAVVIVVIAGYYFMNGESITERLQKVYLFVLSTYILCSFVMYSYSIYYVSNHKAMRVHMFRCRTPLLAVLWMFFTVDTVLNVLLEGLLCLHLYAHRSYEVIAPSAYETKPKAFAVDPGISASSSLVHANA